MQRKVKAELHEIWMAETRFDERNGVLGEEAGGAASILRLSSRALVAYPYDQPDRIDLRYGSPAEQTQPELRFSSNDLDDGV